MDWTYVWLAMSFPSTLLGWTVSHPPRGDTDRTRKSYEKTSLRDYRPLRNLRKRDTPQPGPRRSNIFSPTARRPGPSSVGSLGLPRLKCRSQRTRDTLGPVRQLERLGVKEVEIYPYWRRTGFILGAVCHPRNIHRRGAESNAATAPSPVSPVPSIKVCRFLDWGKGSCSLI